CGTVGLSEPCKGGDRFNCSKASARCFEDQEPLAISHCRGSRVGHRNRRFGDQTGINVYGTARVPSIKSRSDVSRDLTIGKKRGPVRCRLPKDRWRDTCAAGGQNDRSEPLAVTEAEIVDTRFLRVVLAQ